MSRIPGFPAPVPGETVCSVVARYLHRSASPFARNLDFLGLRSASPYAVLPKGIMTLSRNVPAGHPWCDRPRHIVEQHSAVPLILQFSTPEHYEDIIEGLSLGTIFNPSSALGLTTKSGLFPRGTAKFCPECCLADTQMYGFTVFYRHHQPAFVKYCAEHRTPLVFTCSKCQPLRSQRGRWGMAGRCLCTQPTWSKAILAPADPTIEAPLLWLANQASSLLAQDRTPCRHLMAGLTAALHNHGLRSTVGTTSNSNLHRLFLNKYSLGFLQEVGIGSYISDEYKLPNLSKRFRTTGAHRLAPDVLQLILVAGLFVDDVRSLSELTLDSDQLFYDPRRIRSSTKQRARLTNEQLTTLLKKNDFSPYHAGRSAGLNSAMIVSDAQHHKIPIPLKDGVITRIGYDTLQSVRTALNSGEDKLSISVKYAISRYSIELIVADQPELLRSWTLARSTAALPSSAIPAAIMDDNKAVQDDDASLRTPGRVRLSSTPRVKVERKTRNYGRRLIKERIRIDWSARTSEIDTILSALINHEYTKSERPTRLTITRVKREVGLLNPRQIPSPYKRKVESLINNAVESDDVFRSRLMRWAVREYSKLSIPISSNKLRRIAGLPIKQLHACRELVVRLAAEFNVGFYSRCSLSPIPSIEQNQKKPHILVPADVLRTSTEVQGR